MKTWLITRLKEKTTWAGIATVIGSLSFIPNAAEWSTVVIAAGTAIAGAISILAKEAPKSE